jgi:hypothetical protein
MQEKELIDDCFYVQKARFLWHSFDKEGKGLVTALTREDCISGARFYLKGLQEGFPETKTYDGSVGGKL